MSKSMFSPMPRVHRSFKLDSRVLEAIDRLAEENGTSANAYLETLLLSHAKMTGKMPMDSEMLPDNRGGKREGAGRKKGQEETD